MSTFSVLLADQTLARFTNGDCELRLHVGNPGQAGTLERALAGVAPAIGKPLTFSPPAMHPDLIARMVESTSSASWTGAEINAGQVITHYSIWDEPDLLDIGIAEPNLSVPGDGIVVGIGGVRVSISVFDSTSLDPDPDMSEYVNEYADAY